jgi:hypothetical protein
MTNITLRFAERDEGGFGGSVGSRPLVIDLANNRFRSNFQGNSNIIANFGPVRSYIGVMVTGRLENGHFGPVCGDQTTIVRC